MCVVFRAAWSSLFMTVFTIPLYLEVLLYPYFIDDETKTQMITQVVTESKLKTRGPQSCRLTIVFLHISWGNQ